MRRNTSRRPPDHEDPVRPRDGRVGRSYRTRLIADIVTGKVDVRETAARLRYESEELDSLDEADALAARKGAASSFAVVEGAEA